jgi:hypothetical protein
MPDIAINLRLLLPSGLSCIVTLTLHQSLVFSR